MFENYHVGGSLTVDKIIGGQENVFKHYFGEIPNELDRHHSPFRSDDVPGCRFSYSHGIWYFVDNATYKGRLFFNCIQFVMAMFDINFQEAINKISQEVDFSFTQYYRPPPFKSKITVRHKKMPENNYFTRNYDLPLDYLKNQRITAVDNYWANTRKHDYPKLNAFYNPKQVETYCYNFKEGKELYFPDQDIKYVKSTRGLQYGKENENENYVVLVEGNKDRLILDYHYGLSVIGLDTVHRKPSVVSEKVFIWLDPDESGLVNSKKLETYFPNSVNLTSLDNKYDIADMYKFDKQKLKSIVNVILTKRFD